MVRHLTNKTIIEGLFWWYDSAPTLWLTRSVIRLETDLKRSCTIYDRSSHFPLPLSPKKWSVWKHYRHLVLHNIIISERHQHYQLLPYHSEEKHVGLWSSTKHQRTMPNTKRIGWHFHGHKQHGSMPIITENHNKVCFCVSVDNSECVSFHIGWWDGGITRCLSRTINTVFLCSMGSCWRTECICANTQRHEANHNLIHKP